MTMAKDVSFDWLRVSGPSVWSIAARMQIETVALITRRAQAYMAISDTVALCQDPEGLMIEQVRFWQIAQRDYIETLGGIARPAAPKNDSAPMGASAAVTDCISGQSSGTRDRIVMPNLKAPATEPVLSVAPVGAATQTRQKAGSHDALVRVRKVG